MATISSALRLQDQFSSVIDKSITAMLRMADTMENLNRTADMPNMDSTFGELRQDIGVAQHALDQFNDELIRTDKYANTVQKLGSNFGFFSKAVIVANQGLGLIQKTWSGIDSLGSSSDARIGADARLANINDSLRTQEQLENQVMQAANASRGEYSATAELIARVGRQDYFKGNNAAAISFAETLNKGLVVSGASASESSSAMIQLSQGIASGVLRGEEFNSIMENGSVIADMMASSLGVTKGELRAMAMDGQLTTDVVVSSIMAQSEMIDEQFSAMPTTYGQAMSAISNLTSGFMDSLSQPNMAIDVIITSIENMAVWAATADGTQFFDGIATAATAVVSVLADMAGAVGDIYTFFSDNWSTIEPIIWGVATAVGGLTIAYEVYRGVLFLTNVLDTIHATGQSVTAASLVVTAAAQWGLNAAFLANPMTWVVVGIIILIGAMVALAIWITDLWQTNIDFKVGVIGIWNEVLGFFDGVPLFFQGIGYGIADAFSYAKVFVIEILEDMVNGTIERINRLIEFANNIPGVSIDMISGVSFGAETAIEEEIKRAERAAKLAEGKANAAERAAEREQKLAADADRWRSEAESKKAIEDKAAETPPSSDMPYTPPPVTIGGGKIDKIGSPVDISEQSLAYLNDIAEVQLLESLESTSSLQLSKNDADLLQSSATASDTNVYYIQYTGGVRIKNDIKQGDNAEDIIRRLEEESQNEINTSVSLLEEVLYSG